MKYPILILITLVFLFMSALNAQIYSDWAVHAGEFYDDIATDCATDAAGNTYVTGCYQATAAFGNLSLQCAGASDVFVGKISSSGEWLWVVSAGGTGSDVGSSIALDASGYIYVGGYFTNSASFGACPAVSNGLSDQFVAKLSPFGEFMWVVNGGSTTIDLNQSIAVDSFGNVRIVGLFYETATFGNSVLQSAGNRDIMVGAISNFGLWLWAKRAGSTTIDFVEDIVLDEDGYSYITGSFLWNADCSFGPFTMECAGTYDAYVAALNPIGEWVWAESGGGTLADEGYGIAIKDDMLYITGRVQAVAEFGFHTVGANVEYADILVACLNTSGVWQWAVACGSELLDSGNKVAVDNEGRIVIMGFYRADFLCGNTFLSCDGDSDVFVARLSPTGSWLDATHGGSYALDDPKGLALDAAGNIYIAGYFLQNFYFGGESMDSFGGEDCFVARCIVDHLPDDLAAQSINGSFTPQLNQPATYTVLVENVGINPQSGYSVYLYDQVYNQLASAAGPPLAAGESISIPLTWTPTLPGNYTLEGRLILSGDMYEPNNSAPLMTVSVLQMGALTGVARLVDGTPLEGATIECSNYSVSDIYTTGEDGFYVFLLPTGMYNLTAMHIDYPYVTHNSVLVQQGNTTYLDFVFGQVASDDPQVPAVAFGITGCYPDPFKDRARIRYSLKESQAVTICVYDIRGRRVATLWDGFRSAGDGCVEWDGMDDRGKQLANGVYLCRMAGGGKTSSIRLILLR